MGGPANAAPAPTQTSNSTSSSSVQLSPEQQMLLNLGLGGFTKAIASPPERYQGNTVAGFTAPQISGQEMALAAAQNQGDIAKRATGTQDWYMGDIWNPGSNPSLQGAIDAAVRPVYQNLTDVTLPAIRGSFNSNPEGWGSSRQGIAEGIATRGASQAAADAASKIAEDEYRTNIQAQLQALGLTPMLQSAILTPSGVTSAVGDVQQAQQQQQINANVANWNYDQWLPYLMSKEALATVGSIPGGTTVQNTQGTATGSVPPPPNPWQQALGTTMQGAAIGATVGGLPGAAIGGAGGALLPFILNR